MGVERGMAGREVGPEDGSGGPDGDRGKEGDEDDGEETGDEENEPTGDDRFCG